MQDETYIDSRGVEMPAMSWGEALGIVRDLASQNQLGDGHVAGDPNLAAIRDWQQAAIDRVEEIVERHAGDLDAMEPSAKAEDWPDEAWRCQPKSDPADAANAIRICLDLAQEAALDPQEADGIEMADEIDRQQQAFDVTRDLLGMHAQAVSAIVRAPRP